MDSTGKSIPERMAKALLSGTLKCQRQDGWASFGGLSRYLKIAEAQLTECALVNDSKDFRFTTRKIKGQLFIRCDRYEAAADESSAQDTSSCNAERQVPIGAPQRRPVRHQNKFRFNRSRVQQATIIGAPQQRRAGRQGKAAAVVASGRHMQRRVTCARRSSNRWTQPVPMSKSGRRWLICTSGKRLDTRWKSIEKPGCR